ADMHEINLGLVEKEVIVKGSNFETAVERNAHYGVHLVFEEYRIAHDHRTAMGGRCERGPGAEPHKGRHRPAIHLHFHVITGLADFKDILIGDHGALDADDLLDFGGIERRLRERWLSEQCHSRAKSENSKPHVRSPCWSAFLARFRVILRARSH